MFALKKAGADTNLTGSSTSKQRPRSPRSRYRYARFTARQAEGDERTDLGRSKRLTSALAGYEASNRPNHPGRRSRVGRGAQQRFCRASQSQAVRR